ncbi:prenyltransferase [Methanocella sp. CWC-04]|uniref:Prenyltransferase n=1 Tax=Methanooceanicella nereidis TaxID=2052831 RepID=A0AAP2W6V8_9EURY|nr:UbiA family prenyltransferase [Methanocella sp. CWC-04]MCD1294506.1 prenyltransferase [Methanocella sp. CWC-04]
MVFKKMKAIWELTRLEHGLIYAFSLVISLMIAYRGMPDLQVALAGSLAAIFAEMGAFALNDYYDVEVDIKNNRTDRPIVRGDITKNEALWLTVITFILSIISITFMNNIGAIIVLILLIAFSILYNVKLKEYGIWGNIYISFTMASPFLFASVLFENSYVLYVLSAIAFLIGVGREIMKGIMDVEGDALRDVKTIARVYGEEKAKYMAVGLYAAGMVLAPLPFFFESLDPSYYLDPVYAVFAAASLAVLTWVCVKLLGSHDIKTVGKMRKVTMVAMILALLGFLLGALI